MQVSSATEGRRGFRARVKVEAGQLRLFHKAVTGHRARPGEECVPLTFPLCLISAEDRFADFLHTLDLDLPRMVHGEQAFSYHAPIPVDAEVHVDLYLTDQTTKRNGALIVTSLKGEVRSLNDRLLVDQTVTLVTVSRTERLR